MHKSNIIKHSELQMKEQSLNSKSKADKIYNNTLQQSKGLNKIIIIFNRNGKAS